MGLLGDVYSAADSLKRRLRGLLSDPMGTVQQNLGMLADDVKVANERNKRMIHNPEQFTEQDMRDSLSSVMNFAPIGMLAKAPRAEAMRIAQQNAAKPISEGGLGLRPDNTPMERAKAMGFDTDAYHGTNRVINDSFDPAMLGENTNAQSAKNAIFSAGDTATPNSYIFSPRSTALESVRKGSMDSIVKELQSIQQEILLHPGKPKSLLIGNKSNATQSQKDAYVNLLRKKDTVNSQFGYINRSASKSDHVSDELGDTELMSGFMPISKIKDAENFSNIMPLRINTDNYLVHNQVDSTIRDVPYADLIESAKNQGKKGVVISNTIDGSYMPTDIYASIDPSSIRSRFAAFDPARRHEADLLGQVNPELLPWLIGGGLLGGYGVKQAQE